MVREYRVVFLSLVHSAIKTKPEDKIKKRRRRNKKTNISATVFVFGFYYAEHEAVGEQQSICERSFVSALLCEDSSFFFLVMALQFSSMGFIVIAANSPMFSSH